MAIKLKKPAQLALFAIVGVILLGGLYGIYSIGWLPGLKPTQSSVPTSANVPTGTELAKSNVAKVALPSSNPTRLTKRAIRVRHWAWNAHTGWMFANGGQTTTAGSLMEKHGIKVQFERQDDVPKMQADLIAFAQELKSGNPQPNNGAHFVTIMGDGYPAFAAEINKVLEKLGPEYKVKVVGSAGRSLGEDQMMGPPEWKNNPQAAKGGVCAGYLRDGDWNIAMKWLSDNGIKNNPDETTYDPDALNWVAADTYIDASNKYIQDFKESRPIVKDGRKTGETKSDVTVNCVVTWTPGDVMVAKKKGGLVRILSTKENDGQMPNAIIGIDKWMRDNSEDVQEMLAAIFEGGDQVKAYPEALKHAAAISAKVYGEEDAEYWEKYFYGVKEKDLKGLDVELGGSAVHNLTDNMNLFGLTPGKANAFEATYTVFGNILVQQYPRLVPAFPPFSEVSDTRYIEAVAKKYPATAAAVDEQVYRESEKITQTLGNRNWNINFQTGSAQLTSSGLKTVEELARDLAINNLVVEIHGHTDNVGNSASNMELSRRRAEAVKDALESKYPGTFPVGRIRVQYHGDGKPLTDNGSEAGRAKNRRVQIILGTTTR